MRCPYCNSEELKVLDTRNVKDGIKRRRECLSCKKRFNSTERCEKATIYIIKKNKSREAFDRDKIKRGIIQATTKRNISIEKIEDFVMGIENKLHQRDNQEINSSELGELILMKLKEFDEVAYVRFASVYKEFKDIKSFIEVVEDIKGGD